MAKRLIVLLGREYIHRGATVGVPASIALKVEF